MDLASPIRAARTNAKRANQVHILIPQLTVVNNGANHAVVVHGAIFWAVNSITSDTKRVTCPAAGRGGVAGKESGGCEVYRAKHDDALGGARQRGSVRPTSARSLPVQYRRLGQYAIAHPSSTSCRDGFGLSLPVDWCSLSVQLAAIWDIG
jgi:hypothetical protein